MTVTMSDTLKAAARSPTSEPTVTVTIADRPCERPRFQLVALYNDAVADSPYAACVTSNGTICRIRTPNGGGAVYRQTITNPLTGSQWTTWTDTGEVSWSDPDDGQPPRVDIARGVAAGEVWMTYGKHGGATDKGHVMTCKSSDHGATWGAWVLALDLGNVTYIRGLALCAGSSYMELFVAFNPGGGSDQDNSIRSMYDNAGTWTARANYLYTRWPIDGIDVIYHTSSSLFQVLIADGSPRQLTYIQFSNTTWTWSTETTILLTGTSAVTAPYEPRWGRSIPDSRYIFTWIERSMSPAYNRACIGFSPLNNWLTEEIQWEWTCNFGFDLFYNATDGYWYFTQVNRAMRALAYTGASGETITIANQRIVAFTHDHDAESPGSFDLTVDNADGAYNSLTGANACIRVNAQLSLNWGYTTSAGLEQIVQTPLWIDAVGYEAAHDRRESYLRIHAHDAWAELDRLAARRQQNFAARSIAYIVQRTWWRVLKRNESDPIAAMATTLPAYQIAPGTRWSTVLRSLCRSVATIARFRSNQSTPTGWTSVEAEVINWTGGTSVWTFTTANNEIPHARYWTRERNAHALYVQAALGYWGEYHDWNNVRADWRDIPIYIEDRTMDTQAEATARANNEWYWHQSPIVDDTIDVWPVPGLEPGDVVTLTDTRYGITSAKRAIRHITTNLDRRASTGRAQLRERVRFLQTLRLDYSS